VAIEVTVVAVGWLLGGTVGIGTIAFALSVGPMIQVLGAVFPALALTEIRDPAEIRGRKARAKGVLATRAAASICPE
jgi:hypothetical protein